MLWCVKCLIIGVVNISEIYVLYIIIHWYHQAQADRGTVTSQLFALSPNVIVIKCYKPIIEMFAFYALVAIVLRRTRILHIPYLNSTSVAISRFQIDCIVIV